MHSLPGKTPSPCTSSQYTASNNLTFDCFDCVLLLLSFFRYNFSVFALNDPPFQCTHYDHDMISTIGLAECLDMLCAVVACVHINILLFI